MPIFNPKTCSINRFSFIPLVVACLLFSHCKKDDHLIYEVNEVESIGVETPKNSPKTEEQYFSILYSNLFQRSLSAEQLFALIDLVQSVGDKETIREIIISGFMNSSDKVIPTESDMRSDLNSFIEEVFLRFYIRMPSQAEKAWFRNFIESDPNVTPELVFLAFALSNEYLYY